MTTCPTKNSVLIGSNITKNYQGSAIIRNINVHLEKGEFVSLLGVSGVGKTTLFNLLSGLEAPDQGQVFLNGMDVTGKAGYVSYMQQKDLLLPFRTIVDNVAVPLRLKGMDKKSARKEAAQYFDDFGLAGAENKYPAQLSGGMRQRAAVLRSYLFSGEIMLLDEPFSALDAITKAAMHRWYRNIASSHGTSAFFITHDIDEAISLSDRIYIMAGVPGELQQELAISVTGQRDETFTMSEEFLAYKRQILAIIQNR